MTGPLGRNPWDREIIRLAVPAFGALVAEPIYLLTDTAIVGRLGTPQLAGLAAAQALLLTAYALCIFLAYGTTSVVARRIGAGDERGAAHQGVQGLWLALGLGTVLGLIGLVFAEPLVDLIGPEDTARGFALTYFRISLVGIPAYLLVLAGTGYLRGRQDTKTPFVVAATTAIGNLVVELVLVFVFDLGVAGSAWSTVMATAAAAAVFSLATVRAAQSYGVGLGIDVPALRAYLRIGFDLFIRTAALRAAFLAAIVVAARLGNVTLAAYEIAFQVWALLAYALDSLAIAAQALVALHLGAGSASRARSAARRVIELGLMLGVGFGVVLLVARRWIPGLFTADQAVIDLAAGALIVVALMQGVNALAFMLDGILIGAGDNAFLARAMVISTAVFLPLAVVVGATEAGLIWLWWSIAAFLAARSATLWWRWRSDAWLVTS